MSARPFLFFAPFLLLFAACDDPGPKNPATVVGRWELVKGFRNQKETETLQGVFFQFGDDGKMTTNLPIGAEAPTDYEVKKNEIHQKLPQPVVYTIRDLTDSMLVLAMEMRGIVFEMHLQKAPPPEVPASQDSLDTPADTLVQ